MEIKTNPVDELIKELGTLPGIGLKTAERLAFHILSVPTSEALKLADAIKTVKEKAKTCARCFNISQEELCPICVAPTRDDATVCVVEQSRDLWSIEKTGTYRGVYHVLQGALCPLDGIGPEHLTIAQLFHRVRNNGVKEVILATNPTAEGDATAYYIQKTLGTSNVRITRIARGIPAGSSIEYANRSILTDAIDGRREL